MSSGTPPSPPLAGSAVPTPPFGPGPGSPISPAPRPKFNPTLPPPLTPSRLSPAYTLGLSTPVHFPLSVFLSITKDLCLHPERNSALILRAEPLHPLNNDGPQWGMAVEEEVRVRLVPKVPKRDAKIAQRCLFLRDGREAKRERGAVVMIPEVGSGEEVPFYHPPVQRLVFLYEGVEEDGREREGDEPEVRGTLSVHYLPFPSTGPSSSSSLPVRGANGHSFINGDANPPSNGHLSPPSRRAPRKRSPLAGPDPEKPPATILTEDNVHEPQRPASTDTSADTQKRLDRTLLALLERLYKFGYGTMNGYKKRVIHDVVVPRESFQDLYMALKDRHRHLDSRAPKAGMALPKLEDVKRHVWKDVAIAAFLMLLWKDMYPPREDDEVGRGGGSGSGEEWDRWGRPAGGFVDLGCGNGLLVHILTSEGYKGRGYELRARRTWPLYPPATREALIELPIDFPSWFPDTVDEWQSGRWKGKEQCVIPEGGFIIGNHADEITPWLPLLSLLPSSPVPHLSLPCCLHTLDALFTPLVFRPPAHPHSPPGGFDEGIEEGQSRYKAYLMWLGWVGLMCGWEWEKEPLRVPSTKGWGIVARRRWAQSEEDLRECRAWALERVGEVRAKGEFKVREKEGKDH